MAAIRKERLPQLDIFRALAIIGVIHVHATSFAAAGAAKDSSIYYLYNLLNIFFKYGTPSFILLSSFVLFYNYYDRPINKDLITRFYKRRLTYILLPYLIVSIGYYMLSRHLNNKLFDMPLSYHVETFSKAIFTGSAYTHLYFVFISIQFYLLFPIVLKLLQSQRWFARFAVPIGLLMQWGFVIWNKYDLHYTSKGSLAISYFGYYLIGAYIAINFDKIKLWLKKPWGEMNAVMRTGTIALWTSWLAAAFAHVQLYHYTRSTNIWWNSLWYEFLWNIHTLLSAFILFHAAFIIHRRAHPIIIKGLTRLGELSFAVYLLHPLILYFYREVPVRFQVFKYSPESLKYFVWIYGGFIVALAVSWIVVQFIFRRFSWSWVLFGSIPRSLAPQKDKVPDKSKAVPGTEESSNKPL